MRRNAHVLLLLRECPPIPARVRRVSEYHETCMLDALPQPGPHRLLRLVWRFDELEPGVLVRVHDVAGGGHYEGRLVRGYGVRVSVRALARVSAERLSGPWERSAQLMND